ARYWSMLCLHSVDVFLAEQALRPDEQKYQGQHVGKPVLDPPAHHGPEIDLRDFLAHADDESAHHGTEDRFEAAEDQYRQRLQRYQPEGKLYPELGAPYDAGHQR